MCSMSKYFQDKKNLNKERLQEMLIKLRADKENKKLYESEIINDGYRMMACCYSVAIDDYYFQREYFDEHLCNSCGKKFGDTLKKAIKECQLRNYQYYIKNDSNNVRIDFSPCFSDLLSSLSHEDQTKRSLLKDSDLYLIVKPDDRTVLRPLEYVFNRKLTFEEWCSLNSNCHKIKQGYGFNEFDDDSPCFKRSQTLESYEGLVKKFNKLDLQAELKFNCPHCCEKNKKNIYEFWIKFKDRKNWFVSYPESNASYSDYSIVYKYLSGNNNYLNLIESMDKDGDTIYKLDIDCALNNIIGSNITYGKNEVKNMFKLYCSRNNVEDEDKEKFLNFLAANDSKILPQTYKEFIDNL